MILQRFVSRDQAFGRPRRILAGGYPEVIRRNDPERRRAWFGSHLTTVPQKNQDATDLSHPDTTEPEPVLADISDISQAL